MLDEFWTNIFLSLSIIQSFDFNAFRPPEDLWSFFDDFNSAHVAAMAPCLYHYDTPRNKVPHYGETGLNAGIMHMDLARMRDIPDGWTRANMAMHDKYKKQIKLADQVRKVRSEEYFMFLL